MNGNTGRHDISLALRGYRVTGLDFSRGMLNQAEKDAEAADAELTFLSEDATSFVIDDSFDGVICMCEGAFGLLGSSDDPIGQPLPILKSVQNAMRPGAKCLFTVLNGYAMVWELFRSDQS